MKKHKSKEDIFEILPKEVVEKWQSIEVNYKKMLESYEKIYSQTIIFLCVVFKQYK
jgi:hypothetical protein